MGTLMPVMFRLYMDTKLFFALLPLIVPNKPKSLTQEVARVVDAPPMIADVGAKPLIVLLFPLSTPVKGVLDVPMGVHSDTPVIAIFPVKIYQALRLLEILMN